MAQSGEKATFLSGGEFAVLISSGSGAANGSTAITIEWKEFGVKLSFTPTVEENNSITLKVAPEVSALDYSNSLALSGYLVPTLVSRKASTVVNLNPGEHLVIGGLKQTEQSQGGEADSGPRAHPAARLLLHQHAHRKRGERPAGRGLPELVEAAATTLPALPTDRKSKLGPGRQREQESP